MCLLMSLLKVIILVVVVKLLLKCRGIWMCVCFVVIGMMVEVLIMLGVMCDLVEYFCYFLIFCG